MNHRLLTAAILIGALAFLAFEAAITGDWQGAFTNALILGLGFEAMVILGRMGLL